MTTLRKFWSDERGATAIEYAFIGGLVSIAIFTALALMGPKLNARFTPVSNALN